jgi:hypothetical protein
MMSAANRMLNRLIRATEQFLKADGFQRRQRSFYRNSEEVTWMINIQKHRYSTPEELEFTINVGVFCTRLHDALWPELDGAGAEAGAHFQVSERIGFLMPRREDHWWRVTEKTDLEMLKVEIMGVITICALPFLGRFQSLADLRKHFVTLLKKGSESYLHALNIAGLDAMSRKSGTVERSITKLRDVARREGISDDVVAEKVFRVQRLAQAK